MPTMRAPLLRWLPEASIGRAFILFPDPWPKKRHHKRRLVSDRRRWRELARVMRPGAELRIATDIGDYARWILLAAAARRASFAWTARRPGRLARAPGRLAADALRAEGAREGRRCNYFRSGAPMTPSVPWLRPSSQSNS